jgi:hypothetical protein
MPEYFVCEPGPMGGCLIVWVGGTLEEAKAFIKRRTSLYNSRDKKHGNPDEYFIYHQESK